MLINYRSLLVINRRRMCQVAEMVKLVDTRDLKSLGDSSLSRFESGSRHIIYPLLWEIFISSFAVKLKKRAEYISALLMYWLDVESSIP